MFWKKKEITASPAVGGTATSTGVKAAPKVKAVPKEGKAKQMKLAGPRPLPKIVQEYITATYGVKANSLGFLNILAKKRTDTARVFDCRIYDPGEALAEKALVKDYNSLDGYHDIVLYEGYYDEDSGEVKLTELRKVNFDVPLFKEAEILKKITELSEPGSSIYFYQNAGSAAGGPLGRGAAIVELNPAHGTKGKKYIVYTANVIGLEVSDQRNRLWDSDKPKEIANWLAATHKARMY